jgi:hypothetical protein
MILDQKNLNRAAFDWCLRNAAESIAKNDRDSAAVWLTIGAEAGADYAPTGMLASAELEGLVRQLAATLAIPADRKREHPPKRWMHVVTEVYPLYGHSTLLRRWIEQDRPGSVHDVLATGQSAPFPEALRQAIEKTGGTVTCLDKSTTEIARADRLRQIGWGVADVMVLHTHPFDIVPLMALGVAGGPPVLLLNHADHIFWPGVSVADVVVNIRQSGAELSKKYRGATTIATLPVPLPDDLAIGEPGRRAEARAAARRQLGVPEDAVLFLTIGQEYKYEPSAGMNFYAAIESLLSQFASARVIAVGPPARGAAKALATSTGGRFLAVGPQRDLSVYHAAADVYLEGFPVGSLTAFLEASLAGLPCVRAPHGIPPTCSADGEAVDGAARPVDQSQYIEMAIALGKSDAESRRLHAAELSDRIRQIHTGVGWLDRLDALRGQIPREHRLNESIAPVDMPHELANFWIAIVNTPARATLDRVMTSALARSLTAGAPIGRQLWIADLQIRDTAASRRLLTWDRRFPPIGLIGQNLLRRRMEADRLESLAIKVWNFGDCAAARRALLKCFAVDPRRMGKRSLLAIFAKSLLGEKVLGLLRRLRHDRTRNGQGPSLGRAETETARREKWKV